MNLKVIYEPSGAAREYATLALNIYKGCTHGCKYCYNNTRWNKGKFFEDPAPRHDIWSRLRKDCETLSSSFHCPEILLSFLSDPYQPAEKDLQYTLKVICMLVIFDLPFTILTKSNLIKRDLRSLANYKKFRLGMTLTTGDHYQAAEWEPNASYPIDRIQTLIEAKKAGIKTWVSLEPVIWPAAAIDLINQFHHLVDFWWVGKLNHINPPEPVDWKQAREDITDALQKHKCRYQFKKSFLDI
jgi:DNA repair photolyase